MPTLKEILIIGFFAAEKIQPFLADMQNLYNVNIRYLQEFTALGTAGGMYHFRDQIRAGNPSGFFVLNGDVCANFPLKELHEFHESKGGILTIMGTEATRQQSVFYGCLVMEKATGQVTHYVEKPETFVSTLINCGVYVCSMEIFQEMANVFNARQENYANYCNGNGKALEHIQLETDIITPLAGSGKLYALPVTNWWSQVKTAGSAIYANRHYLQLYRSLHPERLANTGVKSGVEENGHLTCTIYPDVYIHPTAQVHPTATLGPNVSVGPGVVIGPGVRIRESIILDNVVIREHTLVLYSIINKASQVGEWARVEGTPSDPDPNKPFAKMDNLPLFNSQGKLNPSITILGSDVKLVPEIVVLNCMVMPNKKLERSVKNEIIF